jgi:hypothetical protein
MAREPDASVAPAWSFAGGTSLRIGLWVSLALAWRRANHGRASKRGRLGFLRTSLLGTSTGNRLLETCGPRAVVMLTEETHDSKQPLLGEDDHTHTGHMVPPDGQQPGSGGLSRTRPA